MNLNKVMIIGRVGRDPEGMNVALRLSEAFYDSRAAGENMKDFWADRGKNIA